ncbi:hypothetical protein M0802_002519 [Mischocyttarus mexicanus]|nr:hypothetical protein M0802_002519 [Mischocyttarus mexicanus]
MAEKHKLESINENKSANINIIRTVLPNNKSVIKKSQPIKLGKQNKLHVYVTKRTCLKAQLKWCNKLFNSGSSEIIIHGLGACVEKTCNLALQLKEIYHNILELDIKTSTVELMDNNNLYEDDDDSEMKPRRNSAIHIRVFRKEPIGIISKKVTNRTKYGL